jgi:hypothetical protein
VENYLDPRSSRPVIFDIIGILSSLKAKGSLPGKNYNKQIPHLIKNIDYVISELKSAWENISQEYHRVYGLK